MSSIGDGVRLHYAYNSWAMARILAAAEGLTDEQFNTEGQAGHGSVRTTLIHLAEVQQNWFSWFDGSLTAEQAIMGRVDSDRVTDLVGIRAVWAEIDGRNSAYINGASDDEFDKSMELAFPNGFKTYVPLWNLLLHVANHGTQHRSEIAALLTEFGHSPGPMDMLLYFVERANVEKAG